MPGNIVTAIIPDAKRNLLLAALPEAEWKRWLPQLEQVDMPLGEVLYESSAPLSTTLPCFFIAAAKASSAAGSLPGTSKMRS